MRLFALALSLATPICTSADVRFECSDSAVLEQERIAIRVTELESVMPGVLRVMTTATLEKIFEQATTLSRQGLNVFRNHASGRGCQNRIYQQVLALLRMRDVAFQELVRREDSKSDGGLECSNSTVRTEQSLKEIVTSIEPLWLKAKALPYLEVESVLKRLTLEISAALLESPPAPYVEATQVNGSWSASLAPLPEIECQKGLNDQILRMRQFHELFFQELIERDYAKPSYAR